MFAGNTCACKKGLKELQLISGSWEIIKEEEMEQEEEILMRCRKCRFLILKSPEVRVEDSHGEPFKSESGGCNSEVWYIPEEGMPAWMRDYLDKGDWVKGKLSCPKCEARIGSYNFVTGFRCPCRNRVVPPVHIVKSKVDFTPPFRIVGKEEETETELSTSGSALSNADAV